MGLLPGISAVLIMVQWFRTCALESMGFRYDCRSAPDHDLGRETILNLFSLKWRS